MEHKLHDLFYYDVTSPSCLRNKVSRGPAKANQVSGTKHNEGYYTISIKGKLYKAHRLVWELHNGPIPEGRVIDHIDRDKSNNKIENLRCVSRSENRKNTDAVSATGHKYIYPRANGRLLVHSYSGKHLGVVDTIEEQLQLQQPSSI